jgi:xanthine/uracil/vitamin C permease (AzgA family)
MNWLEKTFKLRENDTTVKREIYGGLISFLAVSPYTNLQKRQVYP